jgi:hypothetical protein
MSTIEERGNARAKQKMHELEAKRLLSLMGDAGIPEDMLEVEPQQIEAMLSKPWAKCGEGAAGVVNYIASQHKVWARTGTYLTIEGGCKFDEAKRDKVMNFCLLKAIIANFNMAIETEDRTSYSGLLQGEFVRTFRNEVVRVVDLISAFPILASYEKDRFALLSSWSKVPVLAIREIDPARGPRENSDAKAILDSVLRQRRLARMPTVLTFIGDSTQILASEKGYGMEITDIAHARHDREAHIIKLMLEAQENVQTNT